MYSISIKNCEVPAKTDMTDKIDLLFCKIIFVTGYLIALLYSPAMFAAMACTFIVLWFIFSRLSFLTDNDKQYIKATSVELECVCGEPEQCIEDGLAIAKKRIVEQEGIEAFLRSLEYGLLLPLIAFGLFIVMKSYFF